MLSNGSSEQIHIYANRHAPMVDTVVFHVRRRRTRGLIVRRLQAVSIAVYDLAVFLQGVGWHQLRDEIVALTDRMAGASESDARPPNGAGEDVLIDVGCPDMFLILDMLRALDGVITYLEDQHDRGNFTTKETKAMTQAFVRDAGALFQKIIVRRQEAMAAWRQGNGAYAA